MVEERQRLCPEEVGEGFFFPRDFLGDAEREGVIEAAREEPAALVAVDGGISDGGGLCWEPPEPGQCG